MVQWSKLSPIFNCTKLQKLDLSGSEFVKGNLSVLLHHDFPSLETLVLRFVHLTPKDLCNLEQANAQGKLQHLRHLNIARKQRNHWEIDICCLVHQVDGTNC